MRPSPTIVTLSLSVVVTALASPLRAQGGTGPAPTIASFEGLWTVSFDHEAGSLGSTTVHPLSHSIVGGPNGANAAQWITQNPATTGLPYPIGPQQTMNTVHAQRVCTVAKSWSGTAISPTLALVHFNHGRS